MQDNIKAAFYARVSSEQQSKSGTISSQIQALLDRANEDNVMIDNKLQFIDDGYSGSTLIRPALEKLRDQAYLGIYNRLYVLNTSRLSRNYAYQFLLMEELKRNGVEVVFLNYKFNDNPEEQMLLQMQSIVAEYERAKIIERSRRGKLYAAKRGSVAVLSCSPYGYRYIDKNSGDGEARYGIILEEAMVVKRIFNWIGIDGYSIGKVCKLLKKESIPTRTGKNYWDRSVIWGMLQNPAYIGKAAYGKTYIDKMRPRLRTFRGGNEQSKRAYSIYQKPKEEWINIPVPAIVEDKIFDAAQEILIENKKRNRESKRGAKHLLQGLLVCSKCGYSYYGKPISPSTRKGKVRNYVYYRCIGSDSYRFGGKRVCENIQVRSDYLEEAVWQDIVILLSNKDHLEEELKRRSSNTVNETKTSNVNDIQIAINRIKKSIERLIDCYEDGLIEKDEFEPRIKKAKDRIKRLEKDFDEQSRINEERKSLKLVITKLKDFVDIVESKLDNIDWLTKREIIRSLIKEIKIGAENVEVIYRIDPDPFKKKLMIEKNKQHCWWRDKPDTRKHLPKRTRLLYSKVKNKN